MNMWKNLNQDDDVEYYRLMDEVHKAYGEDATGLSRERLDQLNWLDDDVVISPMELISVYSVLSYLSEKDPCNRRLMHAKLLLNQWLDACYKNTEARLDYLRSLRKCCGNAGVEDVLRKYHIFMDGSVLSSGWMGKFLDRLLPDLERVEGANKIIIPLHVVRSIEAMAEIPFATVNIYARLRGYEQITAERVQIFPDTTTNQDLEMIPLAELPGSWNQTEDFDTPPQNL